MSGKSDFLRWQFDDIGQQREADVMGVWLFLVTEVLFFGGVFLVYAVYRWWYPEAFLHGSRQLDLVLGTVNTAVLLTSSLFMAAADHAARQERRQLTQWMLAATLLLGVTFLCIKGVEYHHEFREGRVPFLNESFHWTGGEPGHGRLFFNLYFAMTGLHALHLLIGCGVIGGLLVLSRLRALPVRLHMQVRTAGLYWHFVDIVWVFLFPLLYLVR